MFGVAVVTIICLIWPVLHLMNSQSCLTNYPITDFSSVEANQEYADGYYSMTTVYEIPYGYTEPMHISLYLVDNRVSDIAVTFDSINFTSEEYQKSFKNFYKTNVIGRKIDDIQLSRVGGASLTSEAFNQVIQNLKSDAAPK